jgi:hypothetical protein
LLAIGLYTNTGHTQNNGAVLIVFTIKTAPFFCVCPVLCPVFVIGVAVTDLDLLWLLGTQGSMSITKK